MDGIYEGRRAFRAIQLIACHHNRLDDHFGIKAHFPSTMADFLANLWCSLFNHDEEI